MTSFQQRPKTKAKQLYVWNTILYLYCFYIFFSGSLIITSVIVMFEFNLYRQVGQPDVGASTVCYKISFITEPVS